MTDFSRLLAQLTHIDGRKAFALFAGGLTTFLLPRYGLRVETDLLLLLLFASSFGFWFLVAMAVDGFCRVIRRAILTP